MLRVMGSQRVRHDWATELNWSVVLLTIQVQEDLGVLVSVVSDTLRPPWSVAHQAPLSMAFPSKNTGLVCHALLQGFFSTWGSKLGFRHCWRIFYHQSYQGSSIQEDVGKIRISKFQHLNSMKEVPTYSPQKCFSAPFDMSKPFSSLACWCGGLRWMIFRY